MQYKDLQDLRNRENQRKYRNGPNREKYLADKRESSKKYRETHKAQIQEYNKTYRKANKQQRKEYLRKWRAENPDKAKTQSLKDYGIIAEEYNAMCEAQDGVCAICGKPETAIDPRTEKPYALHVDHNHATDEIRGLLCKKCNLMLGNAKEDPAILRAGAAYLERSLVEV